MTKNDTPQKKNADGRYEGTNYRYSDKFISRMTGWIIASIFIGPAIGAGLAIAGESIYGVGDSPEWYTVMCIAFVIGGVLLPLLVAAWLGATSLHRFGGPVGALLVFGIGAMAGREYLGDANTWLWVGLGSIALATLLFFYLGFQAKVPIWLQLPMFKSPRWYITKGDTGADKKADKK